MWRQYPCYPHLSRSSDSSPSIPGKQPIKQIECKFLLSTICSTRSNTVSTNHSLHQTSAQITQSQQQTEMMTHPRSLRPLHISQSRSREKNYSSQTVTGHQLSETRDRKLCQYLKDDKALPGTQQTNPLLVTWPLKPGNTATD